jgi:acetolactate synthase-1/2/3 large subunit
VDIDQEELTVNYVPSVALWCDASEFLEVAAIPAVTSQMSRERWKRTYAGFVQRAAIAPEGTRSASNFLRAIDAALPQDSIIVNDVSIGSYWGWRNIRANGNRDYIYPVHAATLGFALPAALGVKAAEPGRPVVVLCGDGGFLLSACELATSVLYDLPITIIIFNNDSYGVFRDRQFARFGRSSALGLYNPDFLQLAASFGIEAERATTPEAITAAVRYACESGEARIIEVPMDWPSPMPAPLFSPFSPGSGTP